MTTAQNHLIESLPAVDRARLLRLCEPVQWVLGQVLHEAGAPLRHVHYPVDAFASLVARVDDHPALELAMIGREGMLGAHLVLGVDRSPTQALVQGAGNCLRVPSPEFRRLLAASPALKRQLDRYLYVQMAQTVTVAGCLHYHLIGPRLARWLLMSHDRAQADRFHVTHEFLACMLGVRRVGVTVAAGVLQRQGLIRYHRGELTVLDRHGLEAASCSCYAASAAMLAGPQVREARPRPALARP